jgi:hypothetical protein
MLFGLLRSTVTPTPTGLAHGHEHDPPRQREPRPHGIERAHVVREQQRGQAEPAPVTPTIHTATVDRADAAPRERGQRQRQRVRRHPAVVVELDVGIERGAVALELGLGERVGHGRHQASAASAASPASTPSIANSERRSGCRANKTMQQIGA